MDENQINEQQIARQHIENIVDIDDGKMFTTSLIVAQAFEKEHKNVLQAIENLECSKEFAELNFQLCNYSSELAPDGRKYPFYQITRDGFSFLAMGFTGAKAAAWKEKFLAAFNAMEASLSEQRALNAPHYTGAARHSLPCSTSRKYPSRKICTKAQLAAVHGLLDFWCSVEGCSQEYALQQLHTAMRIPSLDELSQSDLLKALSFVWRATFQRTEYSGPPASQSSRKGLDGLMDAWVFFGESKSNAANYVCLTCNAPSLDAISDKDMPKATLAAFMGFMDRLPA